MLVLSRKAGQSVEFPGLGIVVHVARVRGSRVQLGIDAPPEVAVHRSERPRDLSHAATDPTDGAQMGELQDEFRRLHAEFDRLGDSWGQSDPEAARSSIDRIQSRLSRIQRSLARHRSTSSSAQDAAAKPIGDLIKVRGEVLNRLRSGKSGLSSSKKPETPTSKVRDPGSAYRVNLMG